MHRSTSDRLPPSLLHPASGRRSRATAALAAADSPRVWYGGEVAPDGVGLYRRFTMGAAKRGWKLRPDEVEFLLDLYVAYVRQEDEPSPERCLRVLKKRRRTQVG